MTLYHSTNLFSQGPFTWQTIDTNQMNRISSWIISQGLHRIYKYIDLWTGMSYGLQVKLYWQAAVVNYDKSNTIPVVTLQAIAFVLILLKKLYRKRKTDFFFVQGNKSNKKTKWHVYWYIEITKLDILHFTVVKY